MNRVLTAVATVLLVAPPALWLSGRPADDAGVVPSAAPSAPPRASATPEPAGQPELPATATPPPVPPAPASPEVPPVTARSGLLTERSLPAAAVPTRIRIASRGIDAPVVGIGVTDDGALEIPADVAEVGWYHHGPAPGDQGSAVLSGHVDSRSQGRGAFFELRTVEPGDVVEIDTATGRRAFEVVGRRHYGKDVVPLDELFARGGPARLVLITCGGEFDRATGHYRDNVVVYAVPTEA